MADDQVPPEWYGYLAAFECYIEATDQGTAEQARELMRRFAGEIRRTERRPRGGLKGEAQVRALLEFLDRP